MMPKIFIGPMTKNVVDAIIAYCNTTKQSIGLIPSRRQIEDTGGYVNNWTTKEFSNYVKSKSNLIVLERDHGGPGQGLGNDEGILSLVEDCKYFECIHIDPWKKYPAYKDGLEHTINLINFCYNINPKINFEIGTEEAIRRFEVNELDKLVYDLKMSLPITMFNQIKYLVIQSGTSLKGTTQTGHYDDIRLREMIKIGKKYNLLTKEHNGDYIPVSVIKEKFDLGLDSINIAPEFGLIETQTYLDFIKDSHDNELLEKFWDICYKSNKWVKWVDKDFDPVSNKIQLIKICGHYVISSTEFLEIKKRFPYINEEIQKRITTKLIELEYGN